MSGFAARLARVGRVRAHFSLDSCGTNWTGQQIPHPHQVVGRGRKGEHPAHLLDPAMPHFPHQGNRLQPTKALLDSLSLLLTDRVSGMPRRPFINRAASAARAVLALHVV